MPRPRALAATDKAIPSPSLPPPSPLLAAVEVFCAVADAHPERVAAELARSRDPDPSASLARAIHPGWLRPTRPPSVCDTARSVPPPAQEGAESVDPPWRVGGDTDGCAV